jgi:hypothetical protein
VFLDRPVRLATSRSDIPSLKCIRLIFANIPTLITPCSPALFLSGQVNRFWCNNFMNVTGERDR